jgi:hypothetical protein
VVYQGNSDTQNNLGLMYFEGQGVDQNYDQAIEGLQKAAQQSLS